MLNLILNYVDRQFFYGLDTTFDFLTMLISLFIAVYAYKVFRFVKQKRYLYFAFSFMLIFIGFFARFLFDVFVKIEVIDKFLFINNFLS